MIPLLQNDEGAGTDIFWSVTIKLLSITVMSKKKTPAHLAFFQPSIEGYWTSVDKTETSTRGFPCFCCMFLRAVAQGQEGEEASQILEDLVYIYPNTIPTNIQASFVGVLSSFGTWSRLNLGSIVSSMTWDDSEIAIESMQMSDGNYLLFCLKMPKFYSRDSVSRALHRTVVAFKMMNKVFNEPLTAADIPRVSEAMKSHNNGIMNEFTFKDDKQMTNSWTYGNLPIKSFGSKSALAISTELFSFMQKLSDRVLGSAIFFDAMLILSSLSHKLTCMFQFIERVAKSLPTHEVESFDSFQLWVPGGMLPETTDTTLVTLSVISWSKISFFLLIKGHEDIDEILKEAKSLLHNGMSDFAAECDHTAREESKSAGKDAKASGIIAWWPDTGIVKKSRCDPPSLRRMTEIQDEFNSHKMMQELMFCDGEHVTTGLKFLDLHVFVETEDMQKGLASVQHTYQKMFDFLPNLPEELQKL